MTLKTDIRSRSKGDNLRIAYRHPQPAGMAPDFLVPGALNLDCDEKLWVPQADGVSFRPLNFNLSGGGFVNLLRVRRSGVISRHRHGGAVHAFTLRGQWHYLEHSWMATTGSYAFEPPGETHTLVVPEGVDEMITLFHVTGNYIYVDPDGQALGYEDVYTKLDAARAHYTEIGLGASFVDSMIR
ncbi:2,4'-dihydroxyacetophenone dioxygenase family protein [Sphingorhabdus sp.]|jgi:2,4'-dihydroxyacetophenone dioxygenase|uniref:2,4'-dihydroxyacetophenone dioxygenase family protein n=1 Tax=Sphingorhabdus sp. TaxID=1902408 RepID=UPI0037C72B83